MACSQVAHAPLSGRARSPASAPMLKVCGECGAGKTLKAASPHQSHFRPHSQPCRPPRTSAVLRGWQGPSSPSALFTWSQGRGQAGRAREHAGDAGHRAFPPSSSQDSEATSGSRGLRKCTRLQQAPELGRRGENKEEATCLKVPPPNVIHNPADRKEGSTSLPAVSLGNVPLPTCCGNLCFSLLLLVRAGTDSKRATGNRQSGGAER